MNVGFCPQFSQALCCHHPTVQPRLHLFFVEELVATQTMLLSTTAQPWFLPALLPLLLALLLQCPYTL